MGEAVDHRAPRWLRRANLEAKGALNALGHVGPMAAGTLTSQLLLVATLPLIARLYLPREYGAFVFIVSFSQLVLLAATFNMSGLLPTFRRSGEAARFGAAILFTSSAAALLLIFVGGAAAALRAASFPVPIDPLVAAGGGVVACSTAGYLTHRSYAVRLGRTRAAAASALLRSIIYVVAAIVFGFSSLQGEGRGVLLVAATSLGDAAGVAALRRQLPARARRSLNPVRVKAGWRELKHKRKLVLGLAWSHTVLALISLSPVWFIKLHYGPEQTGWFGLALRVILVPVGFFGQALSDVVSRQMAVRYHSGGGIFRPLAKMAVVMATLGSFGFGLVFALGPTWFPLLLGPRWSHASQSLSLLSLLGFSSFVQAGFGFLSALTRQVRFLAIWSAARLCALAGLGGFILVTRAPYERGLALFVASESTFLLGFVIFFLQFAARLAPRAAD